MIHIIISYACCFARSSNSVFMLILETLLATLFQFRDFSLCFACTLVCWLFSSFSRRFPQFPFFYNYTSVPFSFFFFFS